jgi:RNA polymerase sigma factor (sigma-70 family)
VATDRPGLNELYLELVKIKALRASDSGAASERSAFLRLAAFLMKRLLIHHSRPLSRSAEKEELPELPDENVSGPEALAEVESALAHLGEINPELRKVVELKVFEGLSGDEIAARMNCAPRTVGRHWRFARQWLEHEFGKAPPA